MTLSPIRADGLSAPHGFFTRLGGVSDDRYEGLNCGQGSEDDPNAVRENRRRVAETLNVDHLQSLYQVHSADVITLKGPLEDRPKADAMVTTRAGLAIGALHADCAPVLFEAEDGAIVGAAHAGWRGALAGVTDETIKAMRRLGADKISAAVGPTISQRAYEVGPEFMDAFMAEDPESQRFFAGGEGDRMHFDLPGYLLARLRDAGAEATWTGHCTYSEPAKFFSYRRTTHEGGGDYGRLISAITPRT
ncbi:MAG: peptidoglycan editing factor PgeF [Pseudomonadota bacterium]